MNTSTPTRPFPLPSEVGPVPGAEDWEQLYPWFSRFRPEDDERFWFYNSMHFTHAMPAFDLLTAEVPYHAMGAYTTRVFAFPTALGIDWRVLNGRVYITANAVTDPAEIGRRLAVFQQRAGHYYANWDAIYVDWQQRMRALIADMDAIVVPTLPEFEDEAVVLQTRGIAQNHELLVAWHRCLEGYSVMWQHHFEMLMLGYGAYVVFFQFCKQAFPEIDDQTVARMVAGIDVLMFRPDDELKGLARKAVELGLEDCFRADGRPDAVLGALGKAGKAGQAWLAALQQARDPWFNISTGDGFYHFERSWNDDLSVPLAAIANYIGLVQQGGTPERPTAQLQAERQRIIEAYRGLLASDDERVAFDQVLGLAHQVFPYVEDHKFFCEHWLTTRFYAKVREFAALLVRWGLLEDVEDVFQLQHVEVGQALSAVMNAWASGGTPAGRDHFKPLVARRRALMKTLEAWQAPPALGPMPEHIEDPALKMLWGITGETLRAWAAPQSQETANEIRGYAASSGVVEGTARVVRGMEDFGLVQPGDILVCPITHPSWSPLFSRIQAAVSDIGGTMSHMAIVAREYGMPAVVGTGQATRRIVSGQRIRVDGGRGVVTLLDEVA